MGCDSAEDCEQMTFKIQVYNRIGRKPKGAIEVGAQVIGRNNKYIRAITSMQRVKELLGSGKSTLNFQL